MATNTFEQLWRYSNWANDRVLAAFDQNGGQMPASALRLLSHIANAQSTWVSRLAGVKPPVGIWDEHDLARCKQLLEETSQGLRIALARYGDNLDVSVAYTSSRGQSFENTVFDILAQVFNHATYHRAQIAMIMRQHGLEPVNTDYIIFARQ
jgi:uncharacterized damage-inducible protein DinB